MTLEDQWRAALEENTAAREALSRVLATVEHELDELFAARRQDGNEEDSKIN